MSYQWDNKKPTAQMLGRWQPFHDGHYALFEEIIKKTGELEERRKIQASKWMWSQVKEGLLKNFTNNPNIKKYNIYNETPTFLSTKSILQ